MLKRPLVVFSVVVGLLVAGIITFIQSKGFAVVLKRFVARYIPKDIGIEGDFDYFADPSDDSGRSKLESLIAQFDNDSLLPTTGQTQSKLAA